MATGSHDRCRPNSPLNVVIAADRQPQNSDRSDKGSGDDEYEKHLSSFRGTSLLKQGLLLAPYKPGQKA
ncbi:MAG: hypothetical protein ACFNS6_00085 [Candidatus Saccharimonas sp.]